MGIADITAQLGPLFNAAYGNVKKSADIESAEQMKAAASSIAARNMGGSGGYEAGVGNQINKNKQNALAQAMSQIEMAKAGAIGNEYMNEKNRDWQSEQNRWASARAKEDSLQSMGMSVLSSALAGPMTGLNMATSYGTAQKLGMQPADIAAMMWGGNKEKV